ncbi:spermatogenesis-associated protein 7 isoform X3 [Monodelphis domestica]|uniref:Spermatosis associated 7 n=1 Tax=Monodelphis domestica TaxID=13616 RepID=A0A5F8G902_MONDO|nr:spermatogenesis-associated protein 7 isoform X3 [Monodelphis domestica]
MGGKNQDSPRKVSLSTRPPRSAISHLHPHKCDPSALPRPLHPSSWGGPCSRSLPPTLTLVPPGLSFPKRKKDGVGSVRTNYVMPRYVPSSPFTGHLSTKSNAVVDCSMPVSMISSVKYSDQQRREKLKKELAQCEKELKSAKISTQTSNKFSPSPRLSPSRKLSEELPDKDEETEEENDFPSLSKSLPPASDKQFPDFSILEKSFRNETRRSYSTSGTSSPRRQFCVSSRNAATGSTKNTKNPRMFQLFASKAPSGDLLEKHSAHFTNQELPFTPRTLKTEAKSFLSQYRYYTPAKRKKDFQDQLIEAETQTELSSFKTHFIRAELNNMGSEVIIDESDTSNYKIYGMKENFTPSQTLGNSITWDKVKDDILHYPLSRASIPYYLQPSPVKKIQSEEEELLYLSFIEDVTDEILKLGLFSNRVLERLFERHIEKNKHHLEEKKMRHMLHVLKVDLGCTPEGQNEKQNGTLNMSNLFAFEKLGTPEATQLTDENEIIVSPSNNEHHKSLDLQDKNLVDDLIHKEMAFSPPRDIVRPNSENKYSDDNEVIGETNLEPSAQPEEPDVSYTSLDPVSLTDSFEEGSNDLEKTESGSFWGQISPPCVQNSIKENDDHDTETATSNLTEGINEQFPLDN